MSDVLCAYEPCGRAAQKRAAYCPGHMKQREENKPLTPLQPRGRSPRQVLEDAALSLADVKAEATQDDYQRAMVRLCMAAIRYARRSVTKSNKSARVKLPS